MYFPVNMDMIVSMKSIHEISIPGHGFSLHGTSSVAFVPLQNISLMSDSLQEQRRPLFNGAGLSQYLKIVCIPPPQV